MPEALPVSGSALALAAALAWTAGLRLYLVVFVTGLAARLGLVELPAPLMPLSSPPLLAVTALLAALEWRAGRTVGLDSLWDALHTAIRIPAGAALALLAVWPLPLPAAFGAALLGLLLAASTHLAKLACRAIVRTDPYPPGLRGWANAETVLVLAVLGAAVAWPFAFLGAYVLLLALSAWMLPRLWRRLVRAHHDLRQLTGGSRLGLTGTRQA